jgi:hypothetical protein
MNRAIAATTAATAFYPIQICDEPRLGQRARRCEDHWVFGLIFPEFFEAYWLCPFHCHGINVVQLPTLLQGLRD